MNPELGSAIPNRPIIHAMKEEIIHCKGMADNVLHVLAVEDPEFVMWYANEIISRLDDISKQTAHLRDYMVQAREEQRRREAEA